MIKLFEVSTAPLSEPMKAALVEVSKYGVFSGRHPETLRGLQRRDMVRRLKSGRFGLTPAGRRKLKELGK